MLASSSFYLVSLLLFFIRKRINFEKIEREAGVFTNESERKSVEDHYFNSFTQKFIVWLKKNSKNEKWLKYRKIEEKYKIFYLNKKEKNKRKQVFKC